jgi:hypothetical protein
VALHDVPLGDVEERPMRRFFRGLFGGFKDPQRRPRFIIWTGVGVVFLAGMVVIVFGLVSTRWFCASMCHKVQDDTMISYYRSSHSKIHCFACHLPVNANPISFVWHKLETMPELYATVTNKFEFPLNPESELAMKTDPEKMAAERCLQCHDISKRPIRTSPGMIIDHEVHLKQNYSCTYCHNRVAHREDFTLTLKGNKVHPDYMKMEACFRCHGQEAGAKAPGRCPACHTKEFKLKPDDHLISGFSVKGHGEMAKEDVARITEAAAEERKKAEEAAAKSKKPTGLEPKDEAEPIPLVATVSLCKSCHAQKFCDACHGMQIPHPADFKTTHAKTEAKKVDACRKCHKYKDVCGPCHHKGSTESVSWQTQHAGIVKTSGETGCLAKCHKAAFCTECHVRMQIESGR